MNPPFPGKDGTARNLRWVPTKDGVALSFPNCSNCHLRRMPDGTLFPGAPPLAVPVETSPRPDSSKPSLIRQVQLAGHFVDGGSPIRMGSEPLGMWLYRAFGMPWKPDDINAQLKTITQAEYLALVAAGFRGGAFPRWNGSLYYPVKVPDLIGIKDRRYIDHTGTHLNRRTGDLMRYAALVSFAETTEFGPHQMLSADSKRPAARLSDEALYGLAVYIESLKPPANPNPMDEKSMAGEKNLQARALWGMPCPAFVHKQQAYVGARLHAAGEHANHSGHFARHGRHRSGSSIKHAQRHGILQSPLSEGRLVSWPLLA